jgi:hypothetical protein
MLNPRHPVRSTTVALGLVLAFSGGAAAQRFERVSVASDGTPGEQPEPCRVGDEWRWALRRIRVAL